jgi:hypothetical protein
VDRLPALPGRRRVASRRKGSSSGVPMMKRLRTRATDMERVYRGSRGAGGARSVRRWMPRGGPAGVSAAMPAFGARLSDAQQRIAAPETLVAAMSPRKPSCFHPSPDPHAHADDPHRRQHQHCKAAELDRHQIRGLSWRFPSAADDPVLRDPPLEGGIDEQDREAQDPHQMQREARQRPAKRRRAGEIDRRWGAGAHPSERRRFGACRSSTINPPKRVRPELSHDSSRRWEECHPTRFTTTIVRSSC